MSQPSENLGSDLSTIDRFSSDSDREKLRFLASAVVPYGIVEAKGVPEIFHCLRKQEGLSKHAVELLHRMLSKARFKFQYVSLLDKYIKVPNANFQQLSFRERLISVADELGNGDDLKLLLFLIPKEKIGVARETIKSAVHLFQRLIHQRTISADNPSTHDNLAQWLQDIGRKDIANKWSDFGTAVQEQDGLGQAVLPQQECHPQQESSYNVNEGITEQDTPVAMSQPSENLGSDLSTIDRFSSDSDREKLRFLASAVVPYGIVEAKGVPEIFHCLRKQEGLSKHAVELLHRMLSKARFKFQYVSLLDKYIKVPNANFQQLSFRERLISVADELGNGDDLKLLLFLIPEEKIGVARETIKSAVHLFQRLIHQRTISADNPSTHDNLAQWLQDIGRKDIANKWSDFGTAVQEQDGLGQAVLPQQECHPQQESSYNVNEGITEQDTPVDEERHMAAFELAIREKGSLDKTIMQCVFVGPPRSGKSSLMKRIMGGRPTPSSPSTGVADKVIQVEIVRPLTAATCVSGSMWVELSHDGEVVSVVMDTVQSHSGQTAHSETHSQAVAPTSVSSVPEDARQHQPHLPSLSSSDLKPALDFCRNALHRNPGYASQEQGWTVYLTDTGGQIEFQELLPLLVSGPSVFFLVFRLDHDLNERFMVEYVRSTGAVSEPYQSSFTVKEALLQSLASIASMGTYVNRWKQVPLRSKVFFVGTHKDEVSQAQIDRIDCILQRLVRSTGLYEEGMIQFASESRMLLAVNNLSHDDSDVQLVRKAVERVGDRGDFKIRAPPSWLIFSLKVRQHKDRVISYEQCFEIAKQCGIATQDELNEALWFLHTKVGLIRYYQGEGLEDLQKIVITDPQILFDMNTYLVLETFTFDKVDPSIRENFKRKGIFSFDTFERISVNSEQLLTPSLLVKLLEHLHIIARLEEKENEERKYFMPCVLAHTMPAEATSVVERITRAITALLWPSAEQMCNSSSLLIGFRCGYCPKGLFAALVVYLLNDTKARLKWVLQRDRIFRDQISFFVGPYDAVSITVQPKFLEITCTPVSSELAHNCPDTTCGEVRRYIEGGIRTVTSALHYTSDAAHYLAFYCPGGHRGPDQIEPHPAMIVFDADGVPCTFRCELAEGRTFRLPPGHERWFTEVSECSGRQQQGRQSSSETVLPSPPPPSSTAATGSWTARPRIGDRPEMWQLRRFVGVGGATVKVVEGVCADWENLALELQFGGCVIKAVERDHHRVEAACLTVLGKWLDGETRQPVTWETLTECLDNIGHSTLASVLRSELES